MLWNGRCSTDLPTSFLVEDIVRLLIDGMEFVSEKSLVLLSPTCICMHHCQECYQKSFLRLNTRIHDNISTIFRNSLSSLELHESWNTSKFGWNCHSGWGFSFCMMVDFHPLRPISNFPSNFSGSEKHEIDVLVHSIILSVPGLCQVANSKSKS